MSSNNFWDAAPPELRKFAGEIFASIQRTDNKREETAAKADPAKHKLSKVFANSRYRFWDGGKNGRSQSVRFCYSTHRNVAGYFLTWREIVSKTTVKRDSWSARKTRTSAADIARRRYNKFIGASDER